MAHNTDTHRRRDGRTGGQRSRARHRDGRRRGSRAPENLGRNQSGTLTGRGRNPRRGRRPRHRGRTRNSRGVRLPAGNRKTARRRRCRRRTGIRHGPLSGLRTVAHATRGLGGTTRRLGRTPRRGTHTSRLAGSHRSDLRRNVRGFRARTGPQTFTLATGSRNHIPKIRVHRQHHLASTAPVPRLRPTDRFPEPPSIEITSLTERAAVRTGVLATAIGEQLVTVGLGLDGPNRTLRSLLGRPRAGTFFRRTGSGIRLRRVTARFRRRS